MAASEATFRVMGSTAHVIVMGGDPESLLPYATKRLMELERRWTRFDPGSTVSRLNEAGGKPVSVDPDTLALVARTCDGWRSTNGLFDPTVLPAMVAAGYSRPLDAAGRSGASHNGGAAAPGCAAIILDIEAAVVTLPAGLAIDPGGIGKGLAADLVAVELVERGARGAIVNVGGDLRAAGLGSSDTGWTVQIEDPFDDSAQIVTMFITAGGVATTTPLHRRWRSDGEPATHVIDPRTGEPVVTDVASVTVLAAQAWMAEAATKAVAVAGAEYGMNVIEDAGLSGVIVKTDGRISISSRMGAFL